MTVAVVSAWSALIIVEPTLLSRCCPWSEVDWLTSRGGETSRLTSCESGSCCVYCSTAEVQAIGLQPRLCARCKIRSQRNVTDVFLFRTPYDTRISYVRFSKLIKIPDCKKTTSMKQLKSIMSIITLWPNPFSGERHVRFSYMYKILLSDVLCC